MDKKENEELFLQKKQEFLDIIRHARRSKGISLGKLSEMTGMSKGYLSHVESGRVLPGFYNIIRLCTALGIELFQSPK